LRKKKSIKREVSEKIDKLTNSIENVITGDILPTEFHRIRQAEIKQIRVNEWIFDWHEEIKGEGKEVYKITIKGNKDIIQGLLSLSIDNGFVFINLVESAKFNRGKSKLNLGVLGNMFAYACRRSKDEGFGGFVVFVAKTVLKEHYEKTLGAQSINSQRMFIDNHNADKLINQYYNL